MRKVLAPLVLLMFIPQIAFPLDPIRVAILCPLTGIVPQYGMSARDGALLAIEEWNAKGGVLGRRIETFIEDSQCAAGPAWAAAMTAIDQDKVHYIIGEVCSSASIPVSEIANARKILQISPTSTNPGVTVDSSGKVKPYTFRACFIDDVQARAAAGFALQMGFTSAFLLSNPSNEYVNNLAKNFEKEFAAKGGTIVGRESYTGGGADFSKILAKVAAAKPAIVYFPDMANVVSKVLKLAREQGLEMPFMGGDGWESSDLDMAVSDGCYFTTHFAAGDPRPELQIFVRAYAAKYGGAIPDAIAAMSYEATSMLLAAIRIAGEDSVDMVRDALSKIVYNGIAGNVTFDALHNPVKSVTIVKISGGGFQFETSR